MPKKKNQSQQKFEEAIQLLNEAALEKKKEIESLLGDKYENVREKIEEAVSKNQDQFHRMRKLVEDSIEEGQGQLEKKKKQVNSEVRKNPWKYLGGTALGALLLGMMMGSRKK